MTASGNGAEAAKDGVGSSSGLSLRERMRLKAQQQLQDKAQPTSVASSSIDTRDLVAIDVESDEEDLGALTLGRSKRQAALKRPATYSIDPLDDSSRLKRHPNKLPTSLAKYAAVPTSKTKGIDGLLREQQRRAKRGTDADGFSRAEAIALSMEQERLGRMGIAFSDMDSDDVRSAAGERSRSSSVDPRQTKWTNLNTNRNGLNDNGKERETTVRALSPTIPSFLWSSQSEASDSDDDAERHVDASKTKQQVEASLAAVGADEDEKQLALDILQSDVVRSRAGDVSGSKDRITFYRSGKVLAPVTNTFCPLPCVARDKESKASTQVAEKTTATQASVAAAPDAFDWSTLARHILLAGMLLPSLYLDKRQIRRILVWLGISFVLERNVMQSRLISTLFQSLIFQPEKSFYARQLDSTIPRALNDIVRRVPHILNGIGMDDTVFEKCFPDHTSRTDVPCFTVARRKAVPSQTQDGASSSSPSAEFLEFKAYLTQTERDDILINLARLLNTIASASPDPTFVTDNLSVFAGYVSSMAIACAATTNHAVSDAVAGAFNSIFALVAGEGEDTLRKLQAGVCTRTFGALSNDSIAVRARVVGAFPGDCEEISAVGRWLAWYALTEDVARAQTEIKAASPPPDGVAEVVPSSDPCADDGEDDSKGGLGKAESESRRRIQFESLSLDLEMLAKAIDARDPNSPFRIAPATVERLADEESSPSTPRPGSVDTADARSSTSFETILAATQLVSLCLRDLPLHMCSFTPTTPTPSQPHADSAAGKWTKALRHALEPYSSMNPQLDETRIAALQNIVERLAGVNGRIRDDRGNVILQTLAKDRLLMLCHALEYELEVFSGKGEVRGSFIK
ncbi:Mg-transporting ATPase [Pseudozyma hubeiensis SY62]|uniref:Mg-transporting ATPase n=1 Tax=Pseudozyma hubeiensis (strain SY62) TaxID=1305764 RepID=R9NWR4_PSEHS|nr:Mg-transporting ATPase [Pseudozyma hubeiensis SY62]GAC92961.1 Mg-transporting ATPase [Pseudozyma hubeiensis SY62]